MIIIAYVTQLAEILLGLRKQRGASQVALAYALGLDDSEISKYERGVVVPTVKRLLEMFAALGYRLVAMPTLFADTAAERDAVVAAAAKWYAHGPDAELADPGAADRALVEAVQQLVAAELARSVERAQR